jgi:hypothetical protein
MIDLSSVYMRQDLFHIPHIFKHTVIHGCLRESEVCEATRLVGKATPRSVLLFCGEPLQSFATGCNSELVGSSIVSNISRDLSPDPLKFCPRREPGVLAELPVRFEQ